MGELIVLHSVRESRREAMLKSSKARRDLRLRLYSSHYLSPFRSPYPLAGGPPTGKHAGRDPVVPAGDVQAQYPAGTN